jgi:hypothetical protein
MDVKPQRGDILKEKTDNEPKAPEGRHINKPGLAALQYLGLTFLLAAQTASIFQAWAIVEKTIPHPGEMGIYQAALPCIAHPTDVCISSRCQGCIHSLFLLQPLIAINVKTKSPLMRTFCFDCLPNLISKDV